MKKKAIAWSVHHLEELYARIEFPEYQREGNVWSRDAKQRLIDSMIRDFDIASIYVYDNGDGSFDCVDGRQRIGAIMAFLGKDEEDRDRGFEFKTLNEIVADDELPFGVLEGLTYAQVLKRVGEGSAIAKTFVKTLQDYELTVVLLSKSRRPEEFNLQFTRLNLGAILNSGEKLHAMVGDMRDMCFEEKGIGQHMFLDRVKISTRRFSKEQVAAQILAQIFTLRLSEGKEFARTRHYDLQRFFKEYSTLDAKARGWAKEVRGVLDTLAKAFSDPGVLRNRAITVSTVLLAWNLGLDDKTAKVYAEFMKQFLCRLTWQVGKDLDVDPEYRYLIDFQRHVTQASVEKPAVAARAKTLEEQFELWKKKGEILGDKEYRKRTGKEAAQECAQASSDAGKA